MPAGKCVIKLVETRGLLLCGIENVYDQKYLL